MAIRKEQVLAGLTLLVGVWVARGYLGDPPVGKRFNPTKAEYEAKPVPTTTLAGPNNSQPTRLDFATEPSETRALPPRALEFPPRAPLSQAALMLDPGPDHRHAYPLQVDGTPIEPFLTAPAAEAAPVDPQAQAPAPEEPQGTPRRAELEARAAQSYDRIYLVGQPRNPQFGTIDPGGRDLFELEERGDFDGVQLRMRYFDVTKQKITDVRSYGGENQKIEKIVLAGSLRNEVTRRERKIPDTAQASLMERAALIDWLLERARENAWVYDKALEHAARYRELAPGDLAGLRLMRRVLRARGDVAGEQAMLAALAQTGPEGAFRFEAQGVLKAGLGLWADAEADVRRAIELTPSDPRAHATLAELLRQRGRGREALAAALAAEQRMGAVSDAGERQRLGRVIVACRLANGQHAEARAALTATSGDTPQPYLDGCVHYAAGNVTAALEAFRNAGNSGGGGLADAGLGSSGLGTSGAAQLGQAACLACQGKSQEAHDLLLQVYDREPLLRHRAAAGLAWLFVRAQNFESALGWLDRALEADPQDPFTHYLRGRALRLSGQLAPAIDALAAALRGRDDFVHAIAEMAAAQAALAGEGGGEAQAEAAVAARRYADRAVQLAPAPTPQELLELQGIYAFGAADPKAAMAAFTAARDAVADDQRKWFGKGALAVVEYRRGQVDEALAALQKMTQDLGREDPMAKWAASTIAAIEDHAQKETLSDSFERADPGEVWQATDIPIAIQDGRLVFNGVLPKANDAVTAVRLNAVRQGKNFLAVGAVVQPRAGQARTDSFFGIGIELPAGNRVDFRVRLGVRDGKPHLRVIDGRDNGKDSGENKDLAIEGFDFAAAHTLELRVVPLGDPAQKRFELLASWNGAVVHRRPLTLLGGNTPNELSTVLFAEGAKGSTPNVTFDDYRLERRKDVR